MMILQPELISATMVEAALGGVKRKKSPAALERLRFESFTEGRCAQMMHRGAFSEEGPTVDRVHQFIKTQGNKLCGKHHEIYLSDSRKAAPAKWQTVIRQPYC